MVLARAGQGMVPLRMGIQAARMQVRLNSLGYPSRQLGLSPRCCFVADPPRHCPSGQQASSQGIESEAPGGATPTRAVNSVACPSGNLSTPATLCGSSVTRQWAAALLAATTTPFHPFPPPRTHPLP